MQNKDQNKNTKRKDTTRRGGYGRLTRVLSIMMALVFSLTSLGAALPENTGSGTSSVADSVQSDAEVSLDAASSAAAASETTPSPDSTAASTESEPAYDGSAEIRENAGTLKVQAKADAGILPGGVSLQVKRITKDDKETGATYQKVADKVKKDAADDNRELTGFLAYDISFMKDGKEIEPDGKVNVTMDWTAAAKPDDAAETDQKDSDISVLHLEKQNASDKIEDTKVVNLTENKEKGQDQNNQATVQVNEESKAVEKAEMTVDSFSVFTITWSKSSSDSTRTGSVKVRYVDDTGLEINADQIFDDAELARLSQTDGGVVDLSAWANQADGTSRVSGYTYDHAVIGSRNGTTITGVKVEKSIDTQQVRTGYEGDWPNGHYTYKDVKVTVYRLYYTTDASVNTKDSKANQWTLYKDSGSETYANNANIYLIYNNIQKPITIHFLDTSGNAIKSSDEKDLTKVIDAADHTSEYDLADYAKANTPSGYSFSDSNMNSNNAGTNKIILSEDKGSVTIGSVKGTYYRYLKYEDNTVKLARGDKEYQTVSDPVDIYITFTKVNVPQTIKFHHVDTTGTQLAADTAQTLPDKTVWDGYSNALNSTDSHYHVNNIGTYAGSYIGYFGDSEYSNTKDETTLNGIYYKHDTDGTWHTGLGTSTTSVTREIYNKDNKAALLDNIYQMYTGYKGVVIHHVDESGTELTGDTYAAVQNGKSFIAADQASASIKNYKYKNAHLSSATGEVFTDIEYALKDNAWESTIKNDSSTVAVASPVNEVWLVYTRESANQQLTLYYKYINKSGAYSDAYYNDDVKNTTKTITLARGAELSGNGSEQERSLCRYNLRWQS